MTSSNLKIYIAGPISGIVGENKEAFNNAARSLKNLGFFVRNPHEFCRDIPLGSEWHVYMRRCLSQLAECTDIIFLPGWKHSIGANLELKIAESLRMNIHFEMSDFEQLVLSAKNGEEA